MKEQHALAERNGRTTHPLPHLAVLSQEEDEDAEDVEAGISSASEASEDDVPYPTLVLHNARIFRNTLTFWE